MGVYRDMAPTLLGGKGLHFNGIVMAIGGGDVLSPSPVLLKNMHYISMLKVHAKAKQERRRSDDASRRQSSCHALKGQFQGKSYKRFKDPTLRVGAVRLHGV